MDIEDFPEAEKNDLSLWSDDILNIDWFVILRELLKYQHRLKINHSELVLLANFVSFHQDVDSKHYRQYLFLPPECVHLVPL
ncbi:TPA: hypothetical protein ACHIDO_005224 [Escherichia coli]